MLNTGSGSSIYCEEGITEPNGGGGGNPANGTTVCGSDCFDCEKTTTVSVTVVECDPCVNQGGDTDSDGVCDNDDCAPLNPNLPTTPGTACNDGNPNTGNDVIQADGCTCAGTPLQVDLELTKSVNKSIVEPGETALWTISVINKGPATATNVTVRDNFPAGLTYNSANASQGSFNAGTLTWNIGNLAVNQTVTLTINTTVTATSGTIRNFAQIPTGNPDDIDSTPGNDTDQTPNEDDEDDAIITVQPCVNQGGDTDSDGVCDNDDCAPLNPNLPTTPGTACNDGNPNTGNDVIQADGCTCAGTPLVCNLTATFSVTSGCLDDAFLLFADANDPYFPPTNPLYTYSYDIQPQSSVAGLFTTDPRAINVTFNSPGVKTVTATITDPAVPNCQIIKVATFTVEDCSDPCINQGGDTDNDGICDNDDCAPTNPNLPTTPGTACNDGNPNTTNDVIQADGCSCAGTPTGTPDCEQDITISVSPGKITVTGLDGSPVSSLQIFSSAWQQVFSCFANCGASEMVDVPVGTYYVYAKYYTAGYSLICEKQATVTVTGGGCPDADNDGTCDPDDCQPNDPFYPTTPGTPCNDGNPNTTNDVVQADGCTCAGTSPMMVDLELTKSANKSNVSTGETVLWTISVVNKGPAAATGVTVKDNFPAGLTYNSANASQGSFNAGTLTWNIGNLAVNQTVTLTINTTVSATSGNITNFAQVQTANENDIDSTPGNDDNQTSNEDDEDDATVTVQPTDPCVNQGGDSDNDGVCNNQDCQPFDPFYPTTPGTSCNDGNPNTTNDVVQADGCSCAGTPTGGDPDCEEDIDITTGNGTIIVSGLDGAPISSLQVFSATWQPVFSCFANCNGTETINVPAGTYLIYAKYYTAGYQLICEKQATVTVGGGGGPCVNVTNAGTIGFGNTCTSATDYCPNQGNPPTVKNCVAPSGGAGNLEIVWLKSTTSCNFPTTTAEEIEQGLDPHWTMIPGATGLNYSPGNVTEQTCFLRCARRAGCPTFVESNIVTLGISNNCGGGGGGGTPDCANIGISTGAGSITVTGLDGAPVTSVQIFSAAWQPEHNCFANCNSPTATFSVTAGAHYVYVKYYSASYQLICEATETVNVSQFLAAQGTGFEFEAAKHMEHTELIWVHDGDYLVDEYILERSADGVDFEEIYSTYAERDENPDVYRGYDLEPLTGLNRYRVKMLNLDGTVSYSEVKTVEFEDRIDFVLFPNPANQFTNINLESIVGFKGVDIHVYSNMGVRMKHFHLEEVSGKYYQMDLRDLHEGHYSVWLDIPGRRARTVQLVIGRL